MGSPTIGYNPTIGMMVFDTPELGSSTTAASLGSSDRVVDRLPTSASRPGRDRIQCQADYIEVEQMARKFNAVPVK